MDLDKAIERIIDIRDAIDFNKVTILTGSNGKGKSFIRKQVELLLRQDGIKSWNVSMDKRAGFDSAGTGYMVFGRDCEWLPTSINSFNQLEGFATKPKGTFGIIDEIEVGMSEESQYGIALYINNNLQDFKKNNHGLLIITHSKYLVEHIDADAFFNMDGLTKEEWLNREVLPTDFAQLQKESNALFRELQDRMEARHKS